MFTLYTRTRYNGTIRLPFKTSWVTNNTRYSLRVEEKSDYSHRAAFNCFHLNDSLFWFTTAHKHVCKSSDSFNENSQRNILKKFISLALLRTEGAEKYNLENKIRPKTNSQGRFARSRKEESIGSSKSFSFYMYRKKEYRKKINDLIKLSDIYFLPIS